jgi:hypothetical protein
MSVTRRGFFRASAAIVGGVGFASLAATEAEAKIAPNLVGYQTTPKDGHDCKACKLFVPPATCKTVEGVIAPTGWCKMWLKA